MPSDTKQALSASYNPGTLNQHGFPWKLNYFKLLSKYKMMFNFVNMFLIALAFLVICVGIHIVAMALVKEQAMNHMGLVVQAFLAGLKPSIYYVDSSHHYTKYAVKWK